LEKSRESAESERAKSSIEDSKEKRPIDLRSSDLKPQPKPLLSFPCNSLQQITCGSELAASLLEDYEKNGVKLPGDVKASPSGEAPELPEGPPAAVARLLRVLDAFASSSSSSSGAASPSSSAPSSSSRPDATSSLVAAARFASAATKWAGGAGGGKELLGRLHLACAAALSAVASSAASEAAAAAASSTSGPAAAWGAAAPHWARASAAAPETVARALDAAARQGNSESERDRSAFLARAALTQVAVRCGSSPHEAADAVRGAQQLAEEFRKLSTKSEKDALDTFLDLFLESLAKGSPPLASLAAREYGPVVEAVPGLSACVDAAGSAAFEATFGGSGGGSGGGGADMGGLGGLAALLGGGAGGGGGAPDIGSMLGAMLGGGGGSAGGGGGGLGDLMAMLGGAGGGGGGERRS
jgi:hypothetical protein